MAGTDPSPRFVAHVISHTHWDREWYRTVEQYRFRLVRALDRVFALLQHDPAWHAFFLDGQTQALRDYLAVRPAREAVARLLVQAGKLRIGPWCVQPDEQLISGEATLRNLLLGRADARRYGDIEPVGYLADNFGHSSQLPQILRGFGLDSAAFWRGYDENQITSSEVRWRGADGSEILAILLARGYSNAAGFAPGDPAADRFARHLPTLQRLSRSGHLTVLDGIDHALPPEDLAGMLAELTRRFPELEVRHSGWAEYLAAVRDADLDLPILDGELRWAPGLESTFSNRLPQKQANAWCERLLTAYAEPLAAQAMLAGTPYPAEMCARAWRFMVKNAAHDSIGGAHTDAVAADVAHRYKRAAEIGNGVVAEALDALVGMDACWEEPAAEGRLVLYNPLPVPRRGVVACTLDVPDTAGRDWLFTFYGGQGVAFCDARGRAVPAHLVEDTTTVRPIYHARVNPSIRNTHTLHLLLEVGEIPAYGCATLFFSPGQQRPQLQLLEAGIGEAPAEQPLPTLPLLAPEPGVLRNEQVEVRVSSDGTFDLTLREHGRTWRGLHALQDEQDNGNQYAFKFAANRPATRPANGAVSTLLNTPLRAVARVQTTLDVFDERAFSTETLARRYGNTAPTVTCPVTIEIGITRGSALVDIAVTLDNGGAGHRLRAAFPADPAGRLHVQTPFDLVERTPAVQEARSRGVTGAQLEALAGSGMQGILIYEAEGHGWALATRGLYEYQHLPAAGHLDLTVFRSAGTINFGFERYGTAEGGYLPGVHRMEYAVCPFTGGRFSNDVLREADAYLHPVYARQYPSGDAVTVTGPALPDARLRPSAVKKAEGADSVLFRWYNVSEDRVAVTVPLGRRYREIWSCRLDETRERLLVTETDAVTPAVAPKQILTLELVP